MQRKSIVPISAALLFAVIFPFQGHAQSVTAMPTAAEISTLPPYCQARLNRDGDAEKLWRQRMGHKNYVHIHHYCYGLAFMTRAMGTFDQTLSRRMYGRAVGEFDYVLQRWDPSFPLYQEAETQKALAEVLSRR